MVSSANQVNNIEQVQVAGKSNRRVSRFILVICRIDNTNKRVEEYFASFFKTHAVLQQIRGSLVQIPLENLTLVRISSVHPSYIQRIYVATQPPHPNKNSFVRNSLIRSRSFAAFSNSNFFAASLMSDSMFPMYVSSSCCDLNSGSESVSSVRSA